MPSWLDINTNPPMANFWNNIYNGLPWLEIFQHKLLWIDFGVSQLMWDKQCNKQRP